jgi:hypothetical protein
MVANLPVMPETRGSMRALLTISGGQALAHAPTHRIFPPARFSRFQ